MENLNEAWEAVIRYLRPQVGDVAVETWLSSVQPHNIDKTFMVVLVNNDFQRRIIEEHYQERLENAILNVLGLPLTLQVLVKKKDVDPELMEDIPGVPDAINLFRGDANYEYSFENFIVGSANKYAHAAAQAVAKNPATKYNPLFIYGGSGLGKTHLMYAICNEIYKNRPDVNILYTKGEDMTNEFIEALQNKTPSDFRAKYRQVDILMVDDIQFLSGKTGVQEEFFHTFEALYQANKQIVLTSDRPPKEIATLSDRLRYRFEMGLLADIEPPDFETRMAIIKRKAVLFDIDISDDVASYIAGQLKTNVRQLEGAIKRLQAGISLTGDRPTIAAAQAAIRDLQNDNPPVEITIDHIIEEVARSMNVTADDIRSDKRGASITRARQVAIFVVRNVTKLSMEDIGKHFGGRDHTTVLYNVRKAEYLSKVDASINALVKDITKNVSQNL